MIHPDAVVYVIESAGRVKIGTSTQVDKRLQTLQRSMPGPCVLVGTRPGGRQLEAAWHREFKRWRTHGEWFELPEHQHAVLMSRLSGEPRVIQLPKVHPGRPKRGRPQRQSWKRTRVVRAAR